MSILPRREDGSVAGAVCKACGGPVAQTDIEMDGLCGSMFKSNSCTQQCEVWYSGVAKLGEHLPPGFLEFESDKWQVVVDKWLEAGCPGMVQR